MKFSCLTLTLLSDASAFEPFKNRHDLKKAVDLWVTADGYRAGYCRSPRHCDRAAALAKYGHISNWDVSQVKDMNRLFEYKITFNEDLSRWDVSKVTDMNSMFCEAHAFNQDISSWKTSSVTDMAYMFYDTRPRGNSAYHNAINAFDQNLFGWNVDKVKKFQHIVGGQSPMLAKPQNLPCKLQSYRQPANWKCITPPTMAPTKAPTNPPGTTCPFTTCTYTDGNTDVITSTLPGQTEKWHCQKSAVGCECLCHDTFKCTLTHSHASGFSRSLDHC